MTVEEKEKELKPWLDYVNNNDIEVVNGIANNFDVDDINEYKKLYDSYLAGGGFDFFMKHFNTPSQGIGIGKEGSTQLIANFTGNICEFKKLITI